MDCRLLFETLRDDVNLPFAPPACLWTLSTDLEGTLHTEIGREPDLGGLSPWPLTRIERCRRHECGVAVRDMTLDLSATSFRCDSDIGRLFDGDMQGMVVAAHGWHAEAERLGRDVHCGGFNWRTEAW